MPLLGTTRLLIIDILRGTNILPELKRLNKEQYLTRDQLENQSTENTKQVISYARSNVPYYQQYSGPILQKNSYVGIVKNFCLQYIAESYILNQQGVQQACLSIIIQQRKHKVSCGQEYFMHGKLQVTS
jgi:hypothetical protein